VAAERAPEVEAARGVDLKVHADAEPSGGIKKSGDKLSEFGRKGERRAHGRS
jgi:hypothetical protein